jgi:hypothetical protein
LPRSPASSRLQCRRSAPLPLLFLSAAISTTCFTVAVLQPKLKLVRTASE